MTNPVALAPNSQLLCRFLVFSSRPLLHFGQKAQGSFKPVQIVGFRASSSCSSYLFPLNSTHGTMLKDLRCTKLGWQLNYNRICASAVSNGGSGGVGGLGGSGNGNSGGSGDSCGGSSGDGGNSWSFVSW